MSGHNNIYMLHAAALNRHALEKKQPQVSNKKHCLSTLTAALKEVLSPTPTPFSYNTTPRVQPSNGSQGTLGVDIEGGSARVDPSIKSSSIIPDYAYLQKPNDEPGTYEVYHQRRKVTERRKRLGCFTGSCTHRLSTDDGVYSRPADFAANSTRDDNTQSPKPALSTYYHDSDPDIIVERPFTPKLPPKADLPMPVTGKRTDTCSSELLTYQAITQSGRVSTENAGPYSQILANSDTIGGEQGSTNLEQSSVVSSPKTKRPGRTGILLSQLGSPRPRGPANLNAPLQTDSHQHTLHSVPKNSVYQKDPTLCWGCEDAKSKCNKVTGICKRCELYIVPCLEWTPEKMVQTPTTPVHLPQEVIPIHSNYGQRSDSPTLGQSTTRIRISQPGANGKGKATLPVVYPPILPKSPV
ncbi:hypothetical protein L211DRAFT_848367 [Terfezia boudieri ATCC MYA-4762]|uniref:Zn(2)-C6 fungal-type domain-containing protein n=1 Tax=Terfezia boudieri ATCC MYA-4762 TaxID=1051890 RepID=A0A3N4M3W5_9PEZI|nr:hypothetical protein L211DRAFT_848367 [Terfezia boudieri ATCC MYA-4762]